MLYPQRNEMRDLICLDGSWRALVNGQERDIAVPASWNEQYSDLYDYFGIVRYKKSVFIPEYYAERLIWLRFGSVASKATVYINGTKVCYNEGTALPFECEISKYVCCGAENIVEVDVDNSLDPWALPPAVLDDTVAFFQAGYPAVTYDFYPYGGIHRSVYLYTTSKVRIEKIRIDTALDGTVRFGLSLSEEIQGKIEVLCDCVNEAFTFAGRSIEGSIKIENPILWDCNTPHLYELKVKLSDRHGVVDVYTQSFGVREVKLSDNQIWLNNKPVFLKGFGKHEDFHILGKGFSHAITVKDFSLLKWIGANSFRTSHYPYDEEILSYADRNGFLVIGETPFVGLNTRMYTDEILGKATKIIEKMIDRDYNHPSIIMWSMANEPVVKTEEGIHFFKVMYETAKKKDSSRLITYVAQAVPEDNLGMKYYDLICLTRYNAWYYYQGKIDASLDALSEYLDRWHNVDGKCIMVAEFGADTIEGLHYDPPQMFTEEYQAELIRKQYEVFRSKDYVVGIHVWAFADFKTSQSFSRVFLNRKGVFNRERHPKMAAHMLRQMWNTDAHQ